MTSEEKNLLRQANWLVERGYVEGDPFKIVEMIKLRRKAQAQEQNVQDR